MRRSFLPIDKLAEEPYSKILGYPKATTRQILSRIKELKDTSITSVCFEGKTRIGEIDVLGKGYVGIVVLAKMQRRPVALKIRRLDSPRAGLSAEARLLKKANKVRVGPTLFFATKNFLVMEFLDGPKIGEWISCLSAKDRAEFKKVIRSVLEGCFRLDQAGLDHGELSSISKHIIVGKTKSTIIDFESASVKRRVSNVTSATQGIFIGSGIAKKIRRIYRVPTKETIIKHLRQYKNEPTQERFEEILSVLKL